MLDQELGDLKVKQNRGTDKYVSTFRWKWQGGMTPREVIVIYPKKYDKRNIIRHEKPK